MPASGIKGQYFHNTIYEMAAAYAFHISMNHPFTDGNKRTALASALIFLELNGISVNDPKQQLYNTMIQLVEKKLSKNDIALVLEEISGNK